MFCYKFLVSQVLVLFRSSSPLDNDIFSPRKTATLSSAFQEAGPPCWHVEEVGCTGCTLIAAVAAVTALRQGRCFHLSRYTGAFCA